jgi:D-aminoacyl-tRNA deacylase
VITVVQRVSRAQVRVDGEVVGRIERGLLLFVGVERGDTEADADATARKLAALRIFPGRHPMDTSVKDVGGGCLVVSQFTLAGSLRKGNRPGFEGAEQPDRAQALYERVADQLRAEGLPVATGRFAAHMDVDLVNDGPVTFVLIVRDGAVVKTEREC